MAKSNAIIRKYLRSKRSADTTVICSDKTGTRTKNEMTVHPSCLTAPRCILSAVSAMTPLGEITSEATGHLPRVRRTETSAQNRPALQ
jgi:magnesium-transporting ATPase (P-type)